MSTALAAKRAARKRTPPKNAARLASTKPAAPVRAAVLGADVSRSRSPDIHQAAFRALGIAGAYEAHSVSARGFRSLVRSLARDGYRYVNVTIPHKNAAAAMATSRSAAVARVAGAANTTADLCRREKARRARRTEDPRGKHRRPGHARGAA